MKTEPIILRGAASVWLSTSMMERYGAASVITEMVAGRRHIADPIFSHTDAKHDRGSDPWLKIGTAEIVLALTPPDTLAADEIRALQASLEAMRAQHHLAQQAILDRISKLQAITFDSAAA